MDVHLLDGTYELFRHHFALPSHVTAQGREVAATRGVLGSVLGLLESGVNHIGVATDHVVESFRNDLWPGYKTSAGMDPNLLEQFPLLEESLAAMGVVVWPMVELEADDALASAATQAAVSADVDRIFICTPDKDLAQCVVGERVVQLDRRKRLVIDETGVIEKFGVFPSSIPDYLALVGDSADGFPGLPGWGARSAAAVLARWGHLEEIPDDTTGWNVQIRGMDRLGITLREGRDLAYLFRDLATLRADAKLFETIDELRWRGPTSELAAMASSLESAELAERALRAAEKVRA